MTPMTNGVAWIGSKNPTTHAAETYCYFPRERTVLLFVAYRETADGCTIYKPKNSYLQFGKSLWPTHGIFDRLIKLPISSSSLSCWTCQRAAHSYWNFFFSIGSVSSNFHFRNRGGWPDPSVLMTRCRYHRGGENPERSDPVRGSNEGRIVDVALSPFLSNRTELCQRCRSAKFECLMFVEDGEIRLVKIWFRARLVWYRTKSLYLKGKFN